ncbi:histidinol-phosphate transaminase [Virgibacillus kekensis]|uniref:Histidinol-phosphate aminotransferase n=1 Tax=Virgibacillus kekensis TaxID=202261 RepID=A0ABV9DG51_9BACI
MDGKQVLNELTPYKPGKQIEEVKKAYGLTRIVKLASNENPFGYSSSVKQFLKELDPSLEIYPDGYTTELREAMAEKLNIKETQLIFGSGSDEIVQMIGRAFLYPGVNTVMATPTFPQYKHNALVEGAEIREVSTVNGYHDLKAMLGAIDEQTKVVWLCSPNNPTGSLIPREDFYSFMKKCPKHVLVVLDEAYYEYVENGKDPNILKSFTCYENLIVLRTFSKAYGLAGLRVGYGFANENIISKLDVVRGPFNTSSIAQKAAVKSLYDDDFISQSVDRNKAIKADFQEFLDSIGWHYYESETNFLLVSTPVSGTEVFQHLLENGFIVRPGELLGIPRTVRITLGNENDMEQIKEILHQFHVKVSREK